VGYISTVKTESPMWYGQTQGSMEESTHAYWGPIGPLPMAYASPAAGASRESVQNFKVRQREKRV